MAVAALVAAACGAIILVTISATVTQIGCEPISDPGRVAAYTLPLALAAAAAYLVPALLSFRLRARPLPAVVIGLATATVGGGLMLMTFAALFPGLTCVPRPGPGA